MNTMTCHIYQTKAGNQKGRWRWRLKSSNGRTIADSSEGYMTRAKVTRAFEKIVDAVMCQHINLKTDAKLATE